MRNLEDERISEFEPLLQELSQGSSAAAERLVELYSNNILRAVRRSLPRAIRPKVDSFDILQSVWVSVLDKRTRLGQLDSPQRLVAYLASMARLKVLEKYRHYTKMQAFDVRREKRLSEPIGIGPRYVDTLHAKATISDERHPTASSVAEAREAWNRLRSCCDTRDQEIVDLRMAGMTHEEIAKRLNLSTRTVRRSLQRLLLAITE